MSAAQPKPKNPANEALDPEVLEKLGKMFLILSSPNDGDKLAAVNALNRALEANGIDHHVLVARMKKPWLSDSDKKLFNDKLKEAKEAGRLEERRDAQSRSAPEEFTSTDGSTDWRAVARYVSRERHRLPPRNRDQRTVEFIDSMNTLAMSPMTTLSPARSTWLYDLFGKLGGRIT